MAQVAFDTLKFVETLETAGLPTDQAKAISQAVRESHESVDVATKRDLEDVRKEIEARFEKTDAQITEVRKDLSAEIAEVRKEMEARFEKTHAQIAEVRKEMDHRFDKLGLQLTVRMGGMLIVAVGVMTAILRLLK